MDNPLYIEYNTLPQNKFLDLHKIWFMADHRKHNFLSFSQLLFSLFSSLLTSHVLVLNHTHTHTNTHTRTFLLRYSHRDKIGPTFLIPLSLSLTHSHLHSLLKQCVFARACVRVVLFWLMIARRLYQKQKEKGPS
jgi:hypothetical protein